MNPKYWTFGRTKYNGDMPDWATYKGIKGEDNIWLEQFEDAAAYMPINKIIYLKTEETVWVPGVAAWGVVYQDGACVRRYFDES